MSLLIKTHNDPLQRQNYQIAIHQAAHAVAARALGLRIKKKGIVLNKVSDSTGVKYYTDGTTHLSDEGRHSSDAKKRTAFHRLNIVMSLAGPLAERIFRKNPTIDPEVKQVELSLSVLIPKAPIQVSDEYDDEEYLTANFWWLILNTLNLYRSRARI